MGSLGATVTVVKITPSHAGCENADVYIKSDQGLTKFGTFPANTSECYYQDKLYTFTSEGGVVGK